MPIFRRYKHCATIVICILLAAGVRADAPLKTQISDILYRADGTPAAGTLLISWPAFITADGKAVAAGTLSAAIGAGGAVNLELAPNAGATPSGTYYKVVLKLEDGSSSTEYWSVPPGPTATVAAVRTVVVPQSVALQTVSRQYVDQQLAQKASNADVVHLVGDETVDGVKAFASSPTVPPPVDDANVANKAYVDTALRTWGDFVHRAGDTMTGPLMLIGDPTEGTQAATKSYVDTLSGSPNWAAPGADIGSTTPVNLFALDVFAKFGPMADLKAWGGNCNGNDAATEAANTAAFNAAITHLSSTASVSGGYLHLKQCRFDPSILSTLSGAALSRTYTIEIEDAIYVTTTFVKPKNVSIIGTRGAGSDWVQFQSGHQGAIVPVGSVSPVLRAYGASAIENLALPTCPGDGLYVDGRGAGPDALLTLRNVAANCPSGNALTVDGFFWLWAHDTRWLTGTGKSIYITNSDVNMDADSGLLFFYNTIVAGSGVYIDSRRLAADTGRMANSMGNVEFHDLLMETPNNNSRHLLDIDTTNTYGGSIRNITLDHVAIADIWNGSLSSVINVHGPANALVDLNIENSGELVSAASGPLFNDCSRVSGNIVGEVISRGGGSLCAAGQPAALTLVRNGSVDATLPALDSVDPHLQSLAASTALPSDLNNWNTATNGTTVTSGVTDPWGGTTAQTIVGPGGAYRQKQFSQTAAVGDVFVFGGWFKGGNASWSWAQNDVTMDGADGWPLQTGAVGDWHFGYVARKVTASDGGSHWVAVQAYTGVSYAGLFFVRIPAGTMSDGEIARLLRSQMRQFVAGAPAGSWALPAGQSLCFAGDCLNDAAGVLQWKGAGLVNGADIAPKSVNGIRKVDQYPGVDFGAKVAACIAALPSTGGICDARGLTGTQSLSANLTINKSNVVIQLGAPLTVNMGTYQVIVPSGLQNIAMYGPIPWGGNPNSGSSQSTSFSYNGNPGTAFLVGDDSGDLYHIYLANFNLRVWYDPSIGLHATRIHNSTLDRVFVALNTASTATGTQMIFDGGASGWNDTVNVVEYKGYGGKFGVTLIGGAPEANQNGIFFRGGYIGANTKNVAGSICLDVESGSAYVDGLGVQTCDIGAKIATHQGMMPLLRVEDPSVNTGIWLTSASSRNTITTGGWTVVKDDQTDPLSMNHISRAGAAAMGPNGSATFLQGLTAGGLNITQLATPTLQPTVTPTSGAAGTYTYTTVAVSPFGGTTAAGPARTITNGPTTLDGTHYNTIQVGMVYGASTMDVYRMAGGATQGKIASIPVYISLDGGNVTSRFQVVDNGLVADGATPPGTNTTGQASFAGPVTIQGSPLLTSAGNVKTFVLDRITTLTSISTSNYRWYSSRTATASRLSYNLGTSGSGCTTLAVLSLLDGSSGNAILGSWTIPNASSVGYVDATPFTLPANHMIYAQITTAASGCGTSPANLYPIVEYTTQ